MRTVIGVDSSTQTCKVVVRSLGTGDVLRTGRRPHPAGTEVDPEAWWEALQGALDDAGGTADAAGIAIGGQQHGLVALDADGRVIRPALLWNDTRSAPAAAAMTAELGAVEWASRTGSVPVASFTATKLRWMAEAEPELADRIAAVALPHDWLTWRLRGYGPDRPDLDQLTTDRSDASGTSYFDLRSGAWDRQLLSMALRRDASDIVLPTVLGPAESRSVLGSDLVVAAGAGDNAAAALGLGIVSGEAVVSLGTSGTVFASVADSVIDPSGTVACFADASGGFLPIVTTLNAARILDTVASLLAVDHDELARLALTAPAGAEGVVLLPFFDGERTPNLPDETATITGLTTATTTRPNLARAAFEGMLGALASGVTAVREAGVRVDRILLTGGAARSEASVAVAADVFDAEVVVPEPGEYVALGAGVQAAWAVTGTRPSWRPSSRAATTGAGNTQVLGQYRAAFERRYPRS